MKEIDNRLYSVLWCILMGVLFNTAVLTGRGEGILLAMLAGLVGVFFTASYILEVIKK